AVDLRRGERLGRRALGPDHRGHGGLRHRPPDPGAAPPSRHRGGLRAAGRAAPAHVPAKMLFLITACTPQLPSTTSVTPKSTATDMREIASSSLRPCVFMRKWRILRKASRMARSTDDFS